jgi:hypothetical protein
LIDGLLQTRYGSEEALDLIEQIEDECGAEAADKAVDLFCEHWLGEGEGYDRPVPDELDDESDEAAQVVNQCKWSKQKRRLKRRVERGGCLKCGRILPAESPYKTCSVCRKNHHRYYVNQTKGRVGRRYSSKHSKVEQEVE